MRSAARAPRCAARDRLGRLPAFGRLWACNPWALWIEAYRWRILAFYGLGAFVVAALQVGALRGWLAVAGDAYFGVAIVLEGVLESVLAVAGWRAWRSRRVSREIGLGAVVLLTLDARVAAFLVGRPLPPWVERVVELHVDPTVRWRRYGHSGSEAARAFQSALWADYDRILHELVPQRPGTAFLVSTWHRVPAWVDRECQREGFVLEGVRPTWLLQVGESHRRKAQRRMFGELIGRPVNDRCRWRTYVFAAPGRGRG